MNDFRTSPAKAPRACCWNFSIGATTRHQWFSPQSTPRRIGTSVSVLGFTPSASWTALCTTPSGPRPAATTCENTPLVRLRHKARAVGRQWPPEAILAGPQTRKYSRVLVGAALTRPDASGAELGFQRSDEPIAVIFHRLVI